MLVRIQVGMVESRRIVFGGPLTLWVHVLCVLFILKIGCSWLWSFCPNHLWLRRGLHWLHAQLLLYKSHTFKVNFGMAVSRSGQKAKKFKTKERRFSASRWAALTNRSSGLRYAQPLNSSVMQNREVQDPKAKPDLAGSRIRGIRFCGLSFWVVVSVGGF